MQTRKQQIEQAWLHGDAENLTSFRMGAEWADAHPAQSISNLQAEIITLKAELKSACEQLKMNAEDMYKLKHSKKDTITWNDSPAPPRDGNERFSKTYLVCESDGYMYTSKYDFLIEVWSDSVNEVTHWALPPKNPNVK